MNDSQHPGTLFTPSPYQQYNAAGELEIAQLGNGLVETYAYSTRLRVTSGTIGSVYSFGVGYANDGVVTSSTDTVNGNWTFTYDNFNRLATSAESQPAAAYTYNYDRFGNRWQQKLTGGSGYNSLWSFSDSTNQISSDVTYDAAGNTMADGQNTYTYDAENRLISVYNSAYGPYEYAYDALGHRVEKLANNVAQEFYLFDLAGREVTRLNAAGSWISGEVYVGKQHLATYGDSTTTFDHADWLGTERARTNVSSALCESMLSLPFGDGFSTSGSCSDMSPLHFTGKEHDAESNLEDFGARYYNSRYARFVTPDWSSVPAPVPYADLTNPQTLNQYVIVQDNPSSFADLDGHEDDDGGGDDTGGSAGYFAILLGLGDPIPTIAQQPPPPPPSAPPNADSSDKSQSFLGKLGNMIFVKAAVGVGLGLDVTVDGLSGTAEVSAKSEGQVTLSGKVDVSTNLQAAMSGQLPNGTEVGVGITKSDVTVQNGQAVVNSQSTTQVGLLASHGQVGSELNSSQATVFQLGVCLILCLEVGVGINKP